MEKRISRISTEPFTKPSPARKFNTEMFGRLVAGLIVIGLAFGVWIIWPRADEEPPPTTQVAPTTTSIATTTTTPEETSTTAAPTAAVIETVEQAEDLLRQFWFGWFEGIYLGDEDRIKEVVASQPLLDSARAQFDVMVFVDEPSFGATTVTSTELLVNTPECTAIWSTVSSTFRSGQTEGVHVFRKTEGNWRLVNLWPLKADLWEEDCDSQLESLS